MKKNLEIVKFKLLLLKSIRFSNILALISKVLAMEIILLLKFS